MVDETMDQTLKTEQHIDEDEYEVLQSKLQEKTSLINILTFQVGDLITDIEKHNIKIAEQADKIFQLELQNTKLKEENKNLQEKFERNYETIIAYEDKLLDFKNKCDTYGDFEIYFSKNINFDSITTK